MGSAIEVNETDGEIQPVDPRARPEMPTGCGRCSKDNDDFIPEATHPDRGPRILRENEDLVGTCSQVIESNGRHVVTIAGISIAVPCEIAGRVKMGIGRRVGIIRADGRYWAKIL